MTDKEALKKIYNMICKYKETYIFCFDEDYYDLINKIEKICWNQLYETQ